MVTVFVGGGVFKDIIKLKEQGIEKRSKKDPVCKPSHMHPSEDSKNSDQSFIMKYKNKHTVVTN